MTLIIHISLQYTSSQELLIEASVGSEEAKAYASLSSEAEDLISELRRGKATPRALQSCQELINNTLSTGDVGQLLAKHLSFMSDTGSAREQQLHGIIRLSAPDELHQWPWELICVPQTTRALLLQGFELIREVRQASLAASPKKLIRRGRVSTKSSEVFKYSAMRAATTHITRRHNVEVSVIHDRDDLFGDEARETWLFNHVFAVDRQGYITLDTQSDKEPLLLSESPLARQSYLLNITPFIQSREVIATCRSGALTVISRQFEQSVKARAEADRALYHALGSGYHIAGAINWSRVAMAQSDPTGYQWASLVCTSAAHEAGEVIALSPFPPPERKEKPTPHQSGSVNTGSDRSTSTSETGLQEGGVRLAQQPRPEPKTVASFVKETVALIQKSQQSGLDQDKMELALRTAAMRQLSSLVQQRMIKPQADLQRSAQLAQQLIEAGEFPDQPLTLPEQWYGRAQRLADSLGIKVDAVAQATRALITSSSVWITGLDVRTRDLFARGLCEEIYQSFPYELNGNDRVNDEIDEQLIQGLHDVSALTWQGTASTSPGRGEHRDRARHLLVGYQEEGSVWRVYQRPWLIVDFAQLTSPIQREKLKLAMRRQQLTTVKDGKQTISAISKGTRILYTGEEPAQKRTGEVTIRLTIQSERLTELWLRDARGELKHHQLTDTEIETCIQSPLTQSFIAVVHLAIRLELISLSDGYDALLYGLLAGGEEPDFAEAAEIYLSLNMVDDELVKDCLYAFSQLDQDAYETSWNSLYPEDTPPSLPALRVPI